MWRSGRLRILLFTSVVALAFARTERTPTILVIMNSKAPLDEISADDLKSIFLRTKISLKGCPRLEPVIEKSGPAHATFLRSYLGKTDSALQIYYRSLVFSGQGSMPTAVASDSEVVAFVEKTRGAIGYVDASASTGTVKTLRVK